MQPNRFEKGLIYALISGLFILGVGLTARTPLKSHQPEIDFLNVGQGDATLITTEGGKHILIDGGPDKSVLTELGNHLSPTDREIDTVILSHPHADHVAGLDYVLDRYQVNQIYMTGAVHNAPEYQQFLNEIREKNIPTHKAYLDQDFQVDGVNFKCLYPPADISGQTLKDQNEGSDVYDVVANNYHVLMLGDLSAKSQQKIVDSGRLASGFQILKVSHHGSKTGTNSKLFSLIKPKYSVISVGRENKFGHPAPFTLTQLVGSIILRTDQQGTIGFNLTSSGAIPQ